MKWMPVPIDGPLVAVERFVAEHPEFVIDQRIGEKYILTQSPYGFLRKVVRP
jgi:cephalosporin hydroxylase